jgi:hypothetical protein
MDLNIDTNEIAANPQRQKYLEDLIEQTADPVHRRIVDAYARTGTVDGAEVELIKILEEVLRES